MLVSFSTFPFRAFLFPFCAEVEVYVASDAKRRGLKTGLQLNKKTL